MSFWYTTTFTSCCAVNVFTLDKYCRFQLYSKHLELEMIKSYFSLKDAYSRSMGNIISGKVRGTLALSGLVVTWFYEMSNVLRQPALCIYKHKRCRSASAAMQCDQPLCLSVYIA